MGNVIVLTGNGYENGHSEKFRHSPSIHAALFFFLTNKTFMSDTLAHLAQCGLHAISLFIISGTWAFVVLLFTIQNVNQLYLQSTYELLWFSLP